MDAAVAAPPTLRLTEIFLSLQGETTFAGLPTVFVRLTGCPLRCVYCDTAYAFAGGTVRPLDDILDEVASHGVRHVCVTGGEPLAQPGCVVLLRELCDAGYTVSLETSGAMDIAAVDPRVHRIVDMKTPGSGELERNRLSNLPLLGERDQLKFVLTGREDYDWAKAFLAEQPVAGAGEILFSPTWAELPPRQLADWIVADKLPVRMQLQLHKVLWGDEPGR